MLRQKGHTMQTRSALSSKPTIILHTGTHRVFFGGRECGLTRQEYDLLETLACHQDIALSRSQLLDLAWGYGFPGDTRTVDVHIGRLRRKLDLAEELQTVYGHGYRLCSGRVMVVLHREGQTGKIRRDRQCLR